jgi:pseudouridylate synthase I
MGGVTVRNLRLTVAYDGTGYFGFQDQGRDDRPTVQRTLEAAWARLVGESVKIIGAGRTDAGVHAEGQVVNFRTRSAAIPAERVPHAFNSVLPPDIRVTGCDEVPLEFHARFDAIAKQYVYRIDNRPFPSPLLRHFTYFVARPLDVEAMRQGGAFLVGRHDFRAFAGSAHGERSTVRTLTRCSVDEHRGLIEITVEGDAFLNHMVRIIAGTLVKVGHGEHPPEWVAEVLSSQDRRRAGPTLPGKGLTLMWVKYPPLAGKEKTGKLP